MSREKKVNLLIFCEGGEYMKKLEDMSREEREFVLARREYFKRWRAKNKDKVVAINKRFYTKQLNKDKPNQQA